MQQLTVQNTVTSIRGHLMDSADPTATTITPVVCMLTKKKGVNFRCNSEFNERKKDKTTGDYLGEDRRCSFRMFGKDWEEERNMADNMEIAMEIEANTSAIGSVRL